MGQESPMTLVESDRTTRHDGPSHELSITTPSALTKAKERSESTTT